MTKTTKTTANRSNLDNAAIAEEYNLATTQNTNILIGQVWYNPAAFSLAQLQDKAANLRGEGLGRLHVAGIKKLASGGKIVRCVIASE